MAGGREGVADCGEGGGRGKVFRKFVGDFWMFSICEWAIEAMGKIIV